VTKLDAILKDGCAKHANNALKEIINYVHKTSVSMMITTLEDTQLIFKLQREWSSEFQMVIFPSISGFNDALGSPLLCAGVTVYAPLKRWYKPNNTCAVIGIGGLGHLAVQYAAKLGMTVTAFTTSTTRE